MYSPRLTIFHPQNTSTKIANPSTKYPHIYYHSPFATSDSRTTDSSNYLFVWVKTPFHPSSCRLLNGRPSWKMQLFFLIVDSPPEGKRKLNNLYRRQTVLMDLTLDFLFSHHLCERGRGRRDAPEKGREITSSKFISMYN